MQYETLKRYSIAEIGLLAFFVLGLILAHLVVTVRQRITLSDPITFEGSGLSVRYPISSGWKSTANWQYESDNSFILESQQLQGTKRQVLIRWRYQLCDPDASSQEILQKRALQVNGTFNEILTINKPIKIDYAAIQAVNESGRAYYFGIGRLDHGRSIELEVLPTRVDMFFAENLFFTLIDSIQYKSSPQLQSGQELMNQLWETIQSNNLSSIEHEEQAFLVRDPHKQPIGYSYIQFSGSNSTGQLSINNRHYELNQSIINSTLLINGRDQTFHWKSTIQRVGFGRQQAYIISKDATDILSINYNSNQERTFPCSRQLVPELLLPQAIEVFLNQSQESLVLDVLSATGFVVPAMIEKIMPTNASVHLEDVEWAVKVKFMNHPQSFEELYFNKNRQLVGRYEQQPQQPARVWELTTKTELQRIFNDSFRDTLGTVVRVDVSGMN